MSFFAFPRLLCVYFLVYPNIIGKKETDTQ